MKWPGDSGSAVFLAPASLRSWRRAAEACDGRPQSLKQAQSRRGTDDCRQDDPRHQPYSPFPEAHAPERTHCVGPNVAATGGLIAPVEQWCSGMSRDQKPPPRPRDGGSGPAATRFMEERSEPTAVAKRAGRTEDAFVSGIEGCRGRQCRRSRVARSDWLGTGRPALASGVRRCRFPGSGSTSCSSRRLFV